LQRREDAILKPDRVVICRIKRDPSERPALARIRVPLAEKAGLPGAGSSGEQSDSALGVTDQRSDELDAVQMPRP
jgi:hypothetical protein